MRHANLKRKCVLAAQIALAAALFPFSAFAGSPGTAAADFLQFTPSPRATAMGESYTSVTEDPYAAYWNPAGLASVDERELSATYNASFQDVAHQYVSMAYPLRYGSTLDLNVTRLTVAPFQGYDAKGNATYKVQSSDLAIGAAYGRTIMKDEIERPVLNLGANLKLISEMLDKVSANTLALDLGMTYYLRPAKYWMQKTRAHEFRFAFTLRNLGPGLKFDKYVSPLPMSATLGSAWISNPSGNSTFIMSLDQTVSNDDSYIISLGAEYEAFQLLAVRAGYRTGQDIGSGIRFGVGFKLSFIDLDYSMSPFGALGSMHKFGLSMKFGAPAAPTAVAAGTGQRVKSAAIFTTKDKIEKLQNFANDYIELAKKNLEKRQYMAADSNFNKAFSLEPELRGGEWGKKEGRLVTMINSLRFKETPNLEGTFSADSEQANVAHESIMAYVNGNDLKAFLLAHAAWGSNLHGETVFEELLNQLARLSQDRVRHDEILPKTALIKEKLRKAAAAFYMQKFNISVKECEEAVLLDDTSAGVWTRLGSSYFMMGDKAKAKAAYMKALELNPSDKVVKQFIESQWKK